MMPFQRDHKLFSVHRYLTVCPYSGMPCCTVQAQPARLLLALPQLQSVTGVNEMHSSLLRSAHAIDLVAMPWRWQRLRSR